MSLLIAPYVNYYNDKLQKYSHRLLKSYSKTYKEIRLKYQEIQGLRDHIILLSKQPKSYFHKLRTRFKKTYRKTIKYYKEQYKELSLLIAPYVNYYNEQISLYLHSSRAYKKIKRQTKKYLRVTRHIFIKYLYKKYTKAGKQINLLEKINSHIGNWILTRSASFKAFMMKFRDHKINSHETFLNVKKKHVLYDNLIREHSLRLAEMETILIELQEGSKSKTKKKNKK